MKRKLIYLLVIVSFFFPCFLAAQQILNIVMVGDDGITEDVKKAHSFVLIKKNVANKYERLDYKLYGPLRKLRTYSDSTLAIQEGYYLEYDSSGAIKTWGDYSNNLKQNSWRYYNDTGKVYLKETYDKGVLVKSENPDTIKKTDTVAYKDEREANMKGGIRTWIRYLQKNTKADLALQSTRGGKVDVFFRINKEGWPDDIYLKHSVEFVLDEEALRVIRESPQWIPAFQNGKAVNAYRMQPLTFIKE